MNKLTYRKQYFIPILIVLILLLIIVIALNLLPSNKWKKIDAEITKYTVFKAPAESNNILYTIDLRYKYNYKNLNYTSSYSETDTKDQEFVNKLEQKYLVGDELKIKINKENPDENQILNF